MQRRAVCGAGMPNRVLSLLFRCVRVGRHDDLRMVHGDTVQVHRGGGGSSSPVWLGNILECQTLGYTLQGQVITLLGPEFQPRGSR